MVTRTSPAAVAVDCMAMAREARGAPPGEEPVVAEVREGMAGQQWMLAAGVVAEPHLMVVLTPLKQGEQVAYTAAVTAAMVKVAAIMGNVPAVEGAALALVRLSVRLAVVTEPMAAAEAAAEQATALSRPPSRGATAVAALSAVEAGLAAPMTPLPALPEMEVMA